MKKSIILVLSLCLLIVTCIAVKKANIKYSTGNGKISYIATDIKELANDSELIVVGKVEKGKKTVTFSKVEFTISSLNVSETIKGNIHANSKINILQTSNLDIDPILEANEKVLLFLEKYEGSVTDDAYVIKGLYQGHYKIKNDIVKVSKGGNDKLKAEVDAKKLDEVKKEIVNN